MITEIKLANFRIFQEDVTLRIRPITLLTGQNATGKSTMLEFLPFLHHFRWPKGTIMALDPEETFVKLGPNPTLYNAASPHKNVRFSMKAHNYNFHSPRRLPSVEAHYAPGPTPKVISHFRLMDEHNTKQIHSLDMGWAPIRVFDFTPLEQDILHSFTQPLAGITRVDSAEPASLHHLQLLHQAARNEPAHHTFFTNHLHALTGMDDIRFNQEQQSISILGPGQHPDTPPELMASSLLQAINITLRAATMTPFTTLAIDHPELHLDPLAQVEMGAFFAQLWKEKSVFSIIETQSDYILIRLRRLVAQGYLKPQDISIAFFSYEDDSNGPTITNIDINEDGTLTPGLPMDFFGINVVESLHMGTRT